MTQHANTVSYPLSKALNRFVKPITTQMHNFSILAMIVLMVLITIDVILRSFFHAPITGTMELSEFLMVLIIGPVFAYIQNQDKPLNVEMFTANLSDKSKAILDVFVQTICAAFLFVLTREMFLQAEERFLSQETTLLLNIRVWYFFAFATICLFMLGVTHCISLVEVVDKCLKKNTLIFAFLAILLAIIFVIAPFYLVGTSLGMSKGAIGGIMMLYLFILILTGMPIGMAMMIVGIQGTLLVMPTTAIAMGMVGNSPYPTISAAHLSVIPMFILMGELALIGGVSSDLFRTAATWLGPMPGGLAIASVTGCAGFAAVCGESIPTAMTMANVALPAMREKGYNPAFGCACLALGGTLGILIPPSLGFIMYAIVTEQSVGKLFLAGILPGILLTLIICGIIVFRAKRNPSLAPRGDSTTWKEKIQSLTGVLPMIFLFGVIMGGILTGICSPSEGGAVGASATLFYCFIRRRITIKTFIHALKGTAVLTGKIFLIMLGVNILGYFLVATRLPFVLTDLIITYNTGKYFVLFATIILFIVLGCLMNVIPMIMLTLPALFPTIVAMGFDPIWFGVITVLLMELGQITPPIGVLVFAMSGAVPDVSVQAIYKQVAPFFLGIFACILLLIIFPEICLFLPNNF